MNELEQLEQAKNNAYAERNKCVIALAKMAITLGYPAGKALHPIEDTSWEADWRNIIYIDLPVGQVSWHFHDSEYEQFADLPDYKGGWDGHSTAEKYDRLSALSYKQSLDIKEGEG